MLAAMAMLSEQLRGEVTALHPQTNPASSLVLPSKDWNLKEHVLYPLTVTNKPGDYPLQPAWTGVEKVTTRTGWFAKSYADRFVMELQTNKVLRFDRLTVGSGSIFPSREDRYICDTATGKFPGPVYRPALPTDRKLLAMRDVSAVTNFLGIRAFMNWTNAQTVGMSFFTLAPYNSIETLHVEFMKPGNRTEITSILVRRGHCRNQRLIWRRCPGRRQGWCG